MIEIGGDIDAIASSIPLLGTASKQDRDLSRAVVRPSQEIILMAADRIREVYHLARLIEMPGADHHVFLANAPDVLRELHTFSEGWPRP
jgi:hypothetical protein